MRSQSIKTIHVVIADGSTRARLGLSAMLSAQPGIHVAGGATQGDEVLALVADQQPDVVLLDARLPGSDGIKTARMLKMYFPKVRIIIISLYMDHQAEALAAGADMFLIKGCPIEELIGAVRGA